MTDDVADDQQGGFLRPFGDQIEVAADLFGGGQEGRGELQAGALGKLGWGERIADRTQVLELMLGRIETLTQRREFLVAPSASRRRRAISSRSPTSRMSRSGALAPESNFRSSASSWWCSWLMTLMARWQTRIARLSASSPTVRLMSMPNASRAGGLLNLGAVAASATRGLLA